jgi:predicted SAM-dependent methyltransferase
MTNQYDICNSKHQIVLSNLLRFEAKSLYGRIFLNRKPPTAQLEKKLLNLGCSSCKFQGWVNADFFNAKGAVDWMLDLRYPLNCCDNVWDGVFTGHTLEHLYPNQVMQLLKELFRTMKPGAWLRISVPDLRKYVIHYYGQSTSQEFSKFRTGCEAIRNLTQDYSHVSVWDSELLKIFLGEAGFLNIREVSIHESSDPSLLQDRQDRDWESLYMEAQKLTN